MERNDVSFSIPTWRREEIKSIGLAEEQALYMTSPYNLNDFKNGHQSIEFIFTPNEEPSELKSFIAKRELHSKVTKEVALFATFLYEIILNDNHFNGPQRPPASQKHLSEEKHSSQLLGIFKQKILQLNLCKLSEIPKEFQAYYRNQIIKKIIFQYFGKCAYNISLIEILLISNDFLRFAIEVCVKSVLFEGTLLNKFSDSVEFNDEVKFFVSYFGYLFLVPKDQKLGVKHSDVKSRKIFAYEPSQLKSEHYLLKETKDKKIFLFRKENNSTEPIGNHIKKPQEENQTPKIKEIPQVKLKSSPSSKDKPREKVVAHNKTRKKQSSNTFFSCLPCFKHF